MAKAQKIVLFSAALTRGGAERQLVALAKGLKRLGKEVVVVAYDRGSFDDELIAEGIAVCYAYRRGLFGVFGFLYRLAKLLRSLKARVIYSFLGTPNIYAALLKPFLRGAKIVWSVRASNIDIKRYGFSAVAASWLDVLLSPSSDLIIANSNAGKALYIQKGFPKDKIVVIENGIDTDRFNYDEAGAKRFRSEFGVKDDERIVLLAARLDIMKDHPNFLKACAILNQTHNDLRFICVGGGDQSYLNELISLSRTLKIADKTIFTGPRDDMAAVYSSSSSSSSSSFGEGFSNTIAESMACGTICAVTDVGDSARIVGDLGFIAPPKEPKALAEAIEKALIRSRNDPNLRA
ncbi:MAG: glycosyltransferase, partial [Helicobacteraceae bacterium]|nr:glycosyltransferase [Helicobacteraceae bacterium]